MLAASDKFNTTNEALFEIVQPHMQALVQFIQAEIESFEPEIRELAAYTLKHQGKKIRPMLVFFSGWKDQSEPDPNLIQAAAVMELVHQATLVHDDILDDASIRHNMPTISKKYNAHIAVLLGDALFSHALQLASRFPTVDTCRVVSQATRKVCAGEISQSLKTNDISITLEQYYRIIDLKTAELFSASCRAGASQAGYDEDYVEAVSKYGRHLGIAYQIFDDLSDLLDLESNTGKTLGTDLASAKFTLPIILLLSKLSDEEKSNFQTLLDESRNDPAPLISRLREENILKECLDAFYKEIDSAETAIKPFVNLPPYTHLSSISTLIRKLIDRLH